VCRDLLATLVDADAALRRRNRFVPELIGRAYERALLERAIADDPEPGDFEAWLVDRCVELAPESAGELWVRRMAVEIRAQWLAARGQAAHGRAAAGP
jgi:hypothetical protein